MSLSGVSGSWQSAAQALLATLNAQSTASAASTTTSTASTLSSSSSDFATSPAFTPQASWPFAQGVSFSSLMSLQGPPPASDGDGDGDASAGAQSASDLSGVSTNSSLLNLVSAESSTATAQASEMISAIGTPGAGISLSQFESGYASALGDSSASDLSSAQASAVTAAFNAIDANGDGEISSSELTAALQNTQASQGAQGVHHGHHHHHADFGDADATSSTSSQSASDLSLGSPPSAGDVASSLMAALTGSSSGTLSLSDVENAYAQGSGDGSAASLTSDQTSALTSAFNKIDTDGDGKLSVAENAQALQSYMPWLNNAPSSAAGSTTNAGQVSTTA